MREMDIVVLLIVCCCGVAFARPSAFKPKPKYPPPGTNFRSRDSPTDKTMDQIMTGLVGTAGADSNKMMSPNGLILSELDMFLTADQYSSLYQSNSGRRQKRKAVKDTILRWFHGIIPYTMEEGSFNAEETFRIKQAMTEWERYTCIKFRPATPSHPNVVHIKNGRACSSQLGMVGGVQALELDSPGCRFRGLYLHEIGHAIGLIHEHQRPDRDNYVDILLNNVAPYDHFSFTKHSADKVGLFNTDYEYSSIMHYGVTAFSFNGKSQTIRVKDPAREEEIGKVYLKELSFNDVKAVSNMYKCHIECPQNIKCRDGGFVDQNCRCVCPDGTSNCQEGQAAPQPADADCSNEYDDWQCTVWANAGECVRNAKFMETGCRKSCEKCGGSTADGECKDMYSEEKCKKWKSNGDCATNEWFMSRNCKKTCNACADKAARKETNCENKHSDSESCDKWAAEGECEVNPTWMKVNCQRSCQTCHITPTDTDTDTDTGDGECVDSHSDVASCQSWARSGECEKNPTWMLVHCKKSCKVCGGATVCRNIHDDSECEGWAATMECIKNPGWMKRNCAAACNTCQGTTDPQTTSRPEVTTRPRVINPDPSTPCVNLYDGAECTTWAMTGHCDINPSWMHVNCRMACRLCEPDGNQPTTPPTTTDEEDCTCKKNGSDDIRPLSVFILAVLGAVSTILFTV